MIVLSQKEEYLLVVDAIRGLRCSGNRRDAVSLLLGEIKRTTGVEAVGMRLRDGCDYPYFVTLGFPADFAEVERTLCCYDQDGEPRLNGEGDPVLECMCGNIIRGRFDPSLPFFTKGGSFWTNSTTELLARTTEKERQTRTRNRCNREGYESVALIPLRFDNETFGLFQLNDRRKGLFSPSFIRFFEELFTSKNVVEALRQPC